MSDENAGGNGKNWGVTLPEVNYALYNIGLSPLFFERAGFGIRGAMGFYWAGTIRIWSEAYFLQNGSGSVFPSYLQTRNQSYSLRCLVSTTNS